MTAQELKNSILMQAVQGKLVPQDPNDEPASVLLAKIRAEKEQMMKEGKIKKEPISEIYVDPSDNQHYEKVGKTVKCIEDEIPFEIPQSWEWVKLGVIGIWHSGSTPSRTKPKYYGGNIPWLKTGDLNDRYIKSVSEHITELALKETSVKLNPIGSVLIAMYGATIGKLGIADIPLATNQACCACFPANGVFNKYLFYFLMSQKSEFIKRSEGGAQPNISKEKIINTMMPLPPLNEQFRIVNKIVALESHIKEYQYLHEKINQINTSISSQLKKSILQYAIQGKLVEQNPEDEPASELIKRIRLEKEKLIKSGKLKKDKNESYIYRGSDNSYYEKFQNGKETCIDDEIPFEIPQSWEWMRVCNCADIYTGNSISENIKKLKYTGLSEGFNYIGTKDVNFNNTINYDNGIKIPFEEPKFKKAYKNNTLICVEGGSAGRKVAMLSEDVCFGNKLATINSWIINPEYIYLLFQSSIIQDFFKNNMSGIIGGVSINKLKKFIVPVPPLKEQERIVNKVSLLQSLLR